MANRIPFALIALFCFFAGILFATKPAYTLEIQRRFYEKINWKIEPISLAKELRNTCLMGWFLIILSLTILTFSFSRKP